MLSGLVDIATPVITLLVLMAVGLDLRVADFRAIRHRPSLVVAGVVAPVVLLPLVAWGLTRLLEPPPAVAAGMLLLSISPMGGLATTYSLLARANSALSVTLAATACVAAVVTIPVASAGLDLVAGTGHRVAAPVATLVRQVLVGLAPPVLVGMGIRARWPAAASRSLAYVQRTAFLLLIAFVVLVLADTAGRPGVPWRAAFTAVVSFLVASFLAGAGVARVLAAPRGDHFAFGAAFATRSVAIALAVAISLGRQGDFLWLGAVYLVVQMPILSLTAVVRARLAASSFE